MMSGWAQRDAEEREDREDEIVQLDAMLNTAIEAAGLDPNTASVDDLLAWIRERRAEEWQDISTAPKDCDVWVYGANGKQGTATWDESLHRHVSGDESLHRHVSGVASRHTHWRPLPKGPKA